MYGHWMYWDLKQQILLEQMHWNNQYFNGDFNPSCILFNWNLMIGRLNSINLLFYIILL